MLFPKKSPVKFVFRHDASWLLYEQALALGGVVDFWVCSGGISPYYPELIPLFKKRGDIAWIYGGTPKIWESSFAIMDKPLDTWMRGFKGYCRWLTFGPCADPWFKSTGGGTALVYPGDKFGYEKPLPSVRLKLERNSLQDLALLNNGTKNGSDQTRKEVAAILDSKPGDWWNPKAKSRDIPVIEWSNASIRNDSLQPVYERKSFNGERWLKVRKHAIEKAGGK